jgi:hypothetical protein
VCARTRARPRALRRTSPRRLSNSSWGDPCGCLARIRQGAHRGVLHWSRRRPQLGRHPWPNPPATQRTNPDSRSRRRLHHRSPRPARPARRRRASRCRRSRRRRRPARRPAVRRSRARARRVGATSRPRHPVCPVRRSGRRDRRPGPWRPSPRVRSSCSPRPS